MSASPSPLYRTPFPVASVSAFAYVQNTFRLYGQFSKIAINIKFAYFTKFAMLLRGLALRAIYIPGSKTDIILTLK